MLVRITEKCNMGCSHCSVSAGPDGKHMSMDVYERVLKFIDWIRVPMILLSGGEPTLHPDIESMIKKAIEKDLHVTLLSNGTFLEDLAMTEWILKTGVLVQITNDKRFYPREVPIINHPKLMYEHSIRMVSPFGRALENKIATSRQSPLCFNLRSLCRHTHDFKEALIMLRSMEKFCTPSINIDGTISAGEGNTCSTFGTVNDSNLKLTNALCSLTCGRCGLRDNLDHSYKAAIGEI